MRVQSGMDARKLLVGGLSKTAHTCEQNRSHLHKKMPVINVMTKVGIQSDRMQPELQSRECMPMMTY